MFHVPQENMYSSIDYCFFIWPRTRACSNLVHFYVCVCIWPIDSWERNIKIAHMTAELSTSPCKSANFSIYCEVQLLHIHIYMHIAYIYIQSDFIFTIIFFYRHIETFYMTELLSPHAPIWYWWSCTSVAGINCPVHLLHTHRQTLPQIISSEVFEWILCCLNPILRPDVLTNSLGARNHKISRRTECRVWDKK